MDGGAVALVDDGTGFRAASRRVAGGVFDGDVLPGCLPAGRIICSASMRIDTASPMSGCTPPAAPMAEACRILAGFGDGHEVASRRVGDRHPARRGGSVRGTAAPRCRPNPARCRNARIHGGSNAGRPSWRAFPQALGRAQHVDRIDRLVGGDQHERCRRPHRGWRAPPHRWSARCCAPLRAAAAAAAAPAVGGGMEHGFGFASRRHAITRRIAGVAERTSGHSMPKSRHKVGFDRQQREFVDLETGDARPAPWRAHCRHSSEPIRPPAPVTSTERPPARLRIAFSPDWAAAGRTDPRSVTGGQRAAISIRQPRHGGTAPRSPRMPTTRIAIASNEGMAMTSSCTPVSRIRIRR